MDSRTSQILLIMFSVPLIEGAETERSFFVQYGRFKRILFHTEAYQPTKYQLQYLTPEELRQRQTIRKSMRGCLSPESFAKSHMALGTFCYDDKDYWLAFNTICDETTVVEIKVVLTVCRFLNEQC